MGWVSASDNSSQFRFEFLSKEEAINFAKERKFEFEIHDPKVSMIKPKSYSANFTN
jgi:hypothetical protein